MYRPLYAPYACKGLYIVKLPKSQSIKTGCHSVEQAANGQTIFHLLINRRFWTGGACHCTLASGPVSGMMPSATAFSIIKLLAAS
jgi:hypothetical protein